MTWIEYENIILFPLYWNFKKKVHLYCTKTETNNSFLRNQQYIKPELTNFIYTHTHTHTDSFKWLPFVIKEWYGGKFQIRSPEKPKYSK